MAGTERASTPRSTDPGRSAGARDPQSLFGPVQDDMALVEKLIDGVKQVEYEPLARMLIHVLGAGGKRVRPALALLAGTFQDYDLDALAPLAASIEVLHTATLVHDDVIDTAATRRGRATSNALFNNAPSVMLGDFMFAHAAELVARTGNVRVIQLFARTLMRMATGELDQDVSAFDASKQIGDYLHRIGGKTASLFGTACEGGAIASHAPEPWIDALRGYGFNLGVAFQIVDDILDFTGDEAAMGKPVGSDLKEGTLTLPSLLLLEADTSAKNPIRRLFGAQRNRDRYLADAVAAVRAGDTITRSTAIAEDFGERATLALAALPDTDARRTLTSLVTYVLSRNS
ncbi:MAG: polyprenyl synthetase family protein [Chloroflexi bacterium]|nr:polyprenyl synthetase family protein [Chloroflexota bacterium]